MPRPKQTAKSFLSKTALKLLKKVPIDSRNTVIKAFYDFYNGLVSHYAGQVASVDLVAKTRSGIIFKGKQMAITIRNDQQVAFTLQFEDAFGNVATQLGSTPEWGVSDAEVAAVVPAQDGLSAVVQPTGKTGKIIVTVKVDADPDEDVETIVGQAEIEVVAGKAKVIRLQGTVSDFNRESGQGGSEQPEAPKEPEQPSEPEAPSETE